MAQLVPQDINMEESLKAMLMVQGATEYLVLNTQGIPIKKSASITSQRALHIAFLIQDYWSTAKKIINNDLKMHDNSLSKIRMRTSKQQQIIIIQSLNGQATLYLVQNCLKKKENLEIVKKQAPQE